MSYVKTETNIWKSHPDEHNCTQSDTYTTRARSFNRKTTNPHEQWTGRGAREDTICCNRTILLGILNLRAHATRWFPCRAHHNVKYSGSFPSLRNGSIDHHWSYRPCYRPPLSRNRPNQRSRTATSFLRARQWMSCFVDRVSSSRRFVLCISC